MTKQKNILIIEDEKPLSRVLDLKLTHEGFTVTVVQDGQEGFDLLTKNNYDVVLLDLMMPVLDGFQVLEKLKALGRLPYVIVLSNLSQREDEERVLALGAKKYFVKSDTPMSVILEEVKKA